jgi:DNA-binding MarR family transcriptional regulator
MAAAQSTTEAIMPKLTDTQLVILSAAAQRDDRTVLPLPKSLKIQGAAVTKTLESLLKKGLLEETPAGREAVSWRTDKDGRRMTLLITNAGVSALDGGPAGKTAKPRKTKGSGRSAIKKAYHKSNGAPSPAAVHAGTKQAQLIDLLRREDGATIDEAVEALGWQAHSVRGAISGALKKKLGLAVTSMVIDRRGRVYRIEV